MSTLRDDNTTRAPERWVVIQQGRSTWQGPESAIPAHLRAVGGQVEAGRAMETREGERAVSGAVVASDDLISRETALKIASDMALERDRGGNSAAKMQGATAAVIHNAILNLPTANRAIARDVHPDDQWVSELQVNDEAMLAIMSGLARELHNAGLLCSSLGHPVDLQLPFDLGILHREFADLILMAPVSTCSTAPFGGINFRFCPLAYRRLAEAAKDRVRDFVNRDGGGVVGHTESPNKTC